MNNIKYYDQDYYVLGHKTPNILDHYILGHELGKGQWGTTYLCTEIKTGIDYACKTTPKCKLVSEEDVDDIRREIEIMEYLADSINNNIVNIKGTYEDASSVHIVVQLCKGGDLLDPVNRVRRGDERRAAKFTQIIVGVVSTCHSLGVMLRNLKLDRFMLAWEDCDFTLTAIDFGLAVFFQPGEVFTEVVGRADYVAPEVLLKNYGPAADVWSAGVMLYMLLSGVLPFWGDTQGEIFDAILDGYIDFDSDPWPLLSYSAKDLIRKMLCLKPSERLTADEVLIHPWISLNTMDPADFSPEKMAFQDEIDNSDTDDYGGSRTGYQYSDQDGSEYSTTTIDERGQRSYYQQEPDDEVFQEVDQNSISCYLNPPNLQSPIEQMTHCSSSLEYNDGESKFLVKDDKEGYLALAIDPVNSLACENNASRAVEKTVMCENDESRTAHKFSTSEDIAIKDVDKESREATKHVETRTWFEIGSISLGPYFSLKNFTFRRETYKKQ